VLVAVGADCVLRFWDCHSGNCLEHSTADTTAAGHTLCAVALSPDNTKAVTADTAGTVTIWNISSTHSALKALAAATVQRGRPSSALAAGCRTSAAILGGSLLNNLSSRPQSAASGGSPRAFSRPSAASAVCTAQQAVGVSMLATWKAHSDAVMALVWVPAAHAAAVSAGGARIVPQPAGGLGAAAVVQLQAQRSNAGPAPSSRLHLQADQQQQQQLQLQLQQESPLSVGHSCQQQGGQLQQDLQGPLLGRQPEQLCMFHKQPHQPRTSLHQQQQQQLRQQAVLQQQQQQLSTPPHQLQQPGTPLCTAQNTAATHQGNSCLHGAAAFILSAGLDHSMVLWSSRGARVGTFGSGTWTLHDPSTWQDSTEHVIEVRECERLVSGLCKGVRA